MISEQLRLVRVAFADQVHLVERRISTLEAEGRDRPLPMSRRFELMRLQVESWTWQKALVQTTSVDRGMPVGTQVRLKDYGDGTLVGTVMPMEGDCPEPLNWDDPLYSLPIRWEDDTWTWEETGDLVPHVAVRVTAEQAAGLAEYIAKQED